MLIILLITSAFCVAVSSEYLELNQTSFSKAIHSHRILGVAFYAPWCSYSKQLMPIWETLSKQTIIGEGVSLAKVDCVKEPQLYDQENISVFPTIKFYFYGLSLPYTGDQDSQSLQEYFDFLRYDDNLVDIVDESTYADFRRKNLFSRKPLMVGFFDSSTPLSLHFVYACKLYHLICGISDISSLALRFQVEMNTIIIERQFDGEEERAIYSGAGSLETVLSWMNQNMHPRVVPFEEDTRDMMFSHSRPGYQRHVIYIANMKSDDETRHLTPLRALASTLHEKCIFISVDTSNPSEYLQSTLADLLSDGPLPQALIVTSSKDSIQKLKFDTTTGFDFESFTSWVNDHIGFRSSSNVSEL